MFVLYCIIIVLFCFLLYCILLYFIASKLYGVNATIIIFVFVLYCIIIILCCIVFYCILLYFIASKLYGVNATIIIFVFSLYPSPTTNQRSIPNFSFTATLLEQAVRFRFFLWFTICSLLLSLVCVLSPVMRPHSWKSIMILYFPVTRVISPSFSACISLLLLTLSTTPH